MRIKSPQILIVTAIFFFLSLAASGNENTVSQNTDYQQYLRQNIVH